MAAGVDDGNTEESYNEIRLAGRVAAPPVERALPSGDQVVEFRLIVARPDRSGVDTLDCAAWAAGVRRSVRGWRTGDIVGVDGALRRRFWRSPDGPRSRYQIDVSKGRRLRAGG